MAKILLVEDNEMNRDMLSRRLQRKGHEVLMAADGMQGILMAESHAPDLILLDMSLPVIDGWEATRRLKADDDTKAEFLTLVKNHFILNRPRAPNREIYVFIMLLLVYKLLYFYTSGKGYTDYGLYFLAGMFVALEAKKYAIVKTVES